MFLLASATTFYLPIKRPWALEIHGRKNGSGRLHGEAICTYNAYTMGSSKKLGGRLHRDGRLLGRIRYLYRLVLLGTVSTSSPKELVTYSHQLSHFTLQLQSHVHKTTCTNPHTNKMLKKNVQGCRDSHAKRRSNKVQGSNDEPCQAIANMANPKIPGPSLNRERYRVF